MNECWRLDDVGMSGSPTSVGLRGTRARVRHSEKFQLLRVENESPI